MKPAEEEYVRGDFSGSGEAPSLFLVRLPVPDAGTEAGHNVPIPQQAKLLPDADRIFKL